MFDNLRKLDLVYLFIDSKEVIYLYNQTNTMTHCVFKYHSEGTTSKGPCGAGYNTDNVTTTFEQIHSLPEATNITPKDFFIVVPSGCAPHMGDDKIMTITKEMPYTPVMLAICTIGRY